MLRPGYLFVPRVVCNPQPSPQFGDWKPRDHKPSTEINATTSFDLRYHFPGVKPVNYHGNVIAAQIQRKLEARIWALLTMKRGLARILYKSSVATVPD